MRKSFLPMSICLITFACSLTSCKQSTIEQKGSEYKTLTLKKENSTLTTTYTAVINGRQSVEIRPQVSGIITDICVDEGARVKKGQTLFIK